MVSAGGRRSRSSTAEFISALLWRPDVDVVVVDLFTTFSDINWRKMPFSAAFFVRNGGEEECRSPSLRSSWDTDDGGRWKSPDIRERDRKRSKEKERERKYRNERQKGKKKMTRRERKGGKEDKLKPITMQIFLAFLISAVANS